MLPPKQNCNKKNSDSNDKSNQDNYSWYVVMLQRLYKDDSMVVIEVNKKTTLKII